MEWLSQNWVWLLFFAGMVAMHMFGHGGHGGHGGHAGDQNDLKGTSKDRASRTPEQEPGHHH